MADVVSRELPSSPPQLALHAALKNSKSQSNQDKNEWIHSSPCSSTPSLGSSEEKK